MSFFRNGLDTTPPPLPIPPLPRQCYKKRVLYLHSFIPQFHTSNSHDQKKACSLKPLLASPWLTRLLLCTLAMSRSIPSSPLLLALLSLDSAIIAFALQWSTDHWTNDGSLVCFISSSYRPFDCFACGRVFSCLVPEIFGLPPQIGCAVC